ncbi:MAG TPA: response regulator [Ktedonobacterales bacterium]|nr:response regulator [Ktedonobacterales bacterium]
MLLKTTGQDASCGAAGLEDRLRNAQSPIPVLVVDDDDDTRDSLRLLLEYAHHPVAEAASAAAALDYLRSTSAGHVVLLDFLMPVEHAGTLLHAVEQDASLRRHCYVLIPTTPVTAFPEEDQRLIREQCTAVVLKPFNVDDALRTVDAAAAQLP